MGSLRKVASRIAQMGWHEIYVRSRQAAGKRLDLAAYYLRLPPLKRSFTRDRESGAQFFFSPEEVPEILRLLRSVLPREAEDTIRRAEQICRREFDLLGFKKLDFGQDIDWHLDPVNGKRAPLTAWYRVPFLDFEAVGDHKIIWELSRHQHLVVLAKAFLLSGEHKYLDELVVQWRHWWDQNPYPLGINWASSLEVAFRSLSWVWVDHLLRDHPDTPERFLRDLRHAMELHGRHILRYLSTYFAPNTHLLGEAVALMFLGTLYPSFARAAHWRAVGWQITREQAAEQVGADGFHFEQSTHYHVYALDFFLHALLLARQNGLELPPFYERTVAEMHEVLAACTVAGIPPRFGDDDGGRVFNPQRNLTEHLLDPLSAGAIVFERGDWRAPIPGPTEESLWLLGPKRFLESLRPTDSGPPRSSRAFRDCGLHLMVCRDPEPWQLTIKSGPLGVGNCGHGHADALSIQLTGHAREWLIDPGTYSYMSPSERDWFRSTAAHNTLEVGGRSQADPDSPFKWIDVPTVRAERWSSTAEWDYFRGSHTGYLRLQPPVIHRRTVVRLGCMWLIRDEALGSGDTDLLLTWQVAEGLDVVPSSEQAILLADGARGILTLTTTGVGSWNRELEATRWSPAYGSVREIKAVRLSCHAHLPTEIVTALIPGDTEVRLRARDAENGRAYELRSASRTYHLVFGAVPADADEHVEAEEFAVFTSTPGSSQRLVGRIP
jgi:hypothetical protein